MIDFDKNIADFGKNVKKPLYKRSIVWYNYSIKGICGGEYELYRQNKKAEERKKDN